jgi:hypothetical protein
MRRWSGSIRRGAGALFFLAFPLLSGCSHDAAEPVTAQATKAPPISTKRGQVVPAAALSNWVSAAVLRAGSARLTVSSSLVGGTFAKGSVVTTAAAPALQIATTGKPPLQAVVLPGSYYVNPGQPQHGKHWIKLGSVTGALTFQLVSPLISRLAQAGDVASLSNGWAARAPSGSAGPRRWPGSRPRSTTVCCPSRLCWRGSGPSSGRSSRTR